MELKHTRSLGERIRDVVLGTCTRTRDQNTRTRIKRTSVNGDQSCRTAVCPH